MQKLVMVFSEPMLKKCLVRWGCISVRFFFFCASISGFIHNSMSIGFFAHLYVEIIQHEGIMDCLKKILID